MKTNSISSQPSKMCVPNLSLIVPLCTTVSAEKMFHNSTWAPDLNNRFSMENTGRPTGITFVAIQPSLTVDASQSLEALPWP